MKIYVVSKDKVKEKGVKRKVKKLKFCKVDSKNPDIILCYGGDGTFLYAERKFPGIPKLVLNDESVCKLCELGDLDELLKKISEKKYSIKEFQKIQGVVYKSRNGRKVKKYASNDIVVSNRFPYRALRFEVDVKGKMIGPIIGDGIVFSTPFGSTGYFNSVTKRSFKEGFGIAFNNPTEPVKEIVDKDLEVELKVLRNDAHVSFDNDPAMVKISEGDLVNIKKANKYFRIVKVK